MKVNRRWVILQKFDISNAHSEDPSRAEILQFLDTNDTTQAAETAYKWLLDKSLRQQQVVDIDTSLSALGSHVAVNLWDVLSSLSNLGKSVGFSIETSIKNEKLVIVIGNIPDDKPSALLIEELLTLVFTRLANVTSDVTHTNNETTARISMS
jgi:hypothetical protein